MKNEVLNVIVISFLLTALFATGMAIGYSEGKKEQAQPKNAIPTIIWNDDEEAIPEDGTKVIIELTQNDTIYIGSAE